MPHSLKSNNGDDEVKKPRLKNTNNDNTDVKGEIEQLGANVHCQGKRHQAHCAMKMTQNHQRNE